MDSNIDILSDEFLARYISGDLTPLEKISFSEMLNSNQIMEVKEIVSDLHYRDFFKEAVTPIETIDKIENYIERADKFRELKSPEANNSKIV